MNFNIHVSEGAFQGTGEDTMWLPYGKDLRVDIHDDEGKYTFAFIVKRNEPGILGNAILEGIKKIKEKLGKIV